MKLTLAGLRHRHNLTQAQVAAAMGVGPPTVSRFEHQDDLLLSTLVAYVEATGSTLRLLVEYSDDDYDYRYDLVVGGRRGQPHPDPDGPS